MSLLDQTTRIALSAYLHDLGKLAQRANIEVGASELDGNKASYCPKTAPDKGGHYTHIHAAYTALAWDVLEKTKNFPNLRQGCAPFKVAEADGNLPDSVINAAAAHHNPDSFLQWVVATADRVASGFERDEFDQPDGYNASKDREDFRRARLLTLFEQICADKTEEGQLKYRYPLLPLTPEALFPQKKEVCTPMNEAEATQQYHVLWDYLTQKIRDIPASHTGNLPLWLDHFDSLWLTTTHAIPSATPFGSKRIKPEVSLYDHSKAAAALAAALWRWHHENGRETAADLKNGWEDEKILLVQGDFFGIQNFIFAEGNDTNKHAHKLLRGRSFQVALLAECAALTLLEALELPPTSQIINAAGKFLIIAPNTAAAHAAVARVKAEFDVWCLQHTYGEIGIGIATTPASCNDFSQGRFGDLVKKLFEALDEAKHQRFDLTGAAAPVFGEFLDAFDNTTGACAINGRYPASPQASEKRGYALCQLADDQITIGEKLTKQARILVTREADTLGSQALTLAYFGWRISFVKEEEVQGRFGELAKSHSLLRCWDFDGAAQDGTVFRGYARRFVNSYVPMFDAVDAQTADKYGRWEDEAEFDKQHPIKTLHHIACENRTLLENGQWRGEIALTTLKGDIDNLGALFQQGLQQPTFAKWASLSRQTNLFFALWLPWFCEHGSLPSSAGGRGVGGEGNTTPFRNTYTVFAGGDDFFLIGPWRSTIELAGAMREKFAQYVANDQITFSAGMVMTQPKVPARHLARAAESALEQAKHFAPSQPTRPSPPAPLPLAGEGSQKNAATLWSQTISWDDWDALMVKSADELQQLLNETEISSGMLYSLLQLADRAGRDQPSNPRRRPEDSLWRSQLAYRTTRLIKDKAQAQRLNAALTQALQTHRAAYRLPLSVLLYSRRE